MRRCRGWALQRVRWSSQVTRALAVCTLTFGVLLPLCCHRCLYSYYFLKSWYLQQTSEEVLRHSYEAGQEALTYWRDVVVGGSSMANVPEQPELLVTVVTVRRTEGLQYHYLLQVMQQLEVLLQGCGDGPCAAVLVCDVESGPQDNEDAMLVEKRFHVVRRGKRVDLDVNIFEKEKRDYVFCLRQSVGTVKPRNVVLLEDDALPSTDFFSVMHDLLSRRFVTHSLYVKLYHPERLQRYWNPEPYRILEWVGLGVFGASLIFLLLAFFPRFSPPYSVPLFLFLVAYIMVGAELIGRHYLLELRRVSPQLYAVSPATECCTPAMLFPGNMSTRVAELLDAVTCMKGNAKDMVLYRQAGSAHSLEPNAVQHIGAFSSVRANLPHPQVI